MNFVPVAVAFVSALSFAVSQVDAQPVSNCAQVFKSATRADSVLAQMNFESKSVVGEPSVRFVGQMKTSLGVEALVLRKYENREWWSNAHVTPLGYQGNPLGFIHLVGPEIAGFFGFTQIDSNTLSVPRPEVIQSRIDLWNKEVALDAGDRIPISFLISDEVSNSDLNRAFSKQTLLPLSPRGLTLIHDLSYHFPSIVMPKEWTEKAQANMSLLVGFESFLHRKFRDKIPETIEKKIKDKHEFWGTAFLDGPTGNFSVFYALSDPQIISSPQDVNRDSPRARLTKAMNYLIARGDANARLVLETYFPQDLVNEFLLSAEGQVIAKDYDSLPKEIEYSEIRSKIEARLLRWRQLMKRYLEN